MLWETVWHFIKKLSRDLRYDPAIFLLGIYAKESKAGTQTDSRAPMRRAPLFTHNSQKMEAAQCLSVDEWISKMWYIHKWNIIQSQKRAKS